jgi:hypothetical protein
MSDLRDASNMSRTHRRKWFRFALCVCVLAVGSLAGYWLYRLESSRSRLAETIRRLDESEPGWTKDELCAARNGRLPPDELNSFRLIRESKAAFPPGYTSTDPVRDLVDHPSNRQLPMDGLTALQKQVAAGEPALAIARRLAGAPEGGRAMNMSEMPISTDVTEVQDARGVVWALQWDALAAAHAGRPSDAVRSARAALGTGRAIGDEPFAISQLVRIACVGVACRATERMLGLCEPNEGLAELQIELTREADVPRLYYSMLGERAATHQMFLLFESGGIDQFGGPPGVAAGNPGLLARLSSWTIRPLRREEHAICLTMMSDFVEASRRPFDEQRSACRAVPLPADGDSRYVFTLLLVPAIEKTIDASLRCRGELLAVAAGVACERYRQRTGRWPASLEEIPKDILPAVPTDPFTGKPVIVRRVANGILVYSVGPDERDDGGRFEELSDTPGGRKTRDFGIRLWDGDQRRRPSPPRSEPRGGLVPGDAGAP